MITGYIKYFTIFLTVVFLQIIFTGSVQAQTCRGGGICGIHVTSCTCSIGGGNCGPEGSQCGDYSGGRCNCTTVCSNDYPVPAPDHFECPNDTDGGCVQNCVYCVISGSCYWDYGDATPAPTASPSCSCSWQNGSCDAGGCTCQRQQTYVCNYTSCSGHGGTRCVSDSSCVPSVSASLSSTASFYKGQNIAQSWSSSGGTINSCNIDGASVAYPSGSRNYCQGQASQTYNLSCGNTCGGSGGASATSDWNDRPIVCSSSSIGSTSLICGQSTTMTLTGSPPSGLSIDYFFLNFRNNDNYNTTIRFGGADYGLVCRDGSESYCTRSGNSATFTINEADLNRIDENTGLVPTNIQINGYFGTIGCNGLTAFSAAEGACVRTFTINRTPAGAPTNLSPTGLQNCSTSLKNLSWSQGSGATPTNYTVTRPNGTTTTTASTSLSNQAVTRGAVNNWSVRANHPCGNATTNATFTCEWCSISLSPIGTVGNPYPVDRTNTQAVNASIVRLPTTGTSVSSVNFSSSSPTVFPINPTPVPTVGSPNIVVTAAGTIGQTSTITANATMSMGDVCTNNTVLRVVNPAAWWRTQDADVVAAGRLTNTGDLVSRLLRFAMPNPEIFNLSTTGNHPGVPIYARSLDYINSDNVSSKRWLANATYSNPNTYNYAYFEKLQPIDLPQGEGRITSASVVGTYFNTNGTLGHSSQGYTWYFVDGSVSTFTISSAISFTGANSGRRVILFVPGNLNINSNINLTPGTSQFMVIVAGNIVLNSNNVQRLDGVYVTDGVFNTGSYNTVLVTRGSIVANTGVSMLRGLADNSTGPAEVFQYGPEYVMRVPLIFGAQQTDWLQVAPRFDN